jgi:DNA-binding MarR family transcriptional regulator
MVREGIYAMRINSFAKSSDEVEVARLLSKSVLRLARRLRAERRERGLSCNAVGVLAHLKVEGPSTPGAIAEAEQHRPQSLTRILAELEGLALVVRTASPADGRQSVLSLTPAGTKALGGELAIREAWVAQALRSFSPLERQVLAMAAPVLDALSKLR